LPERSPRSFEITCDGAVVSAERDPATGLLEVACNGDGEHTIEVSGLEGL
jgi:predicted lipoprotein